MTEEFCTCDQVNVAACHYAEDEYICVILAHARDKLSKYVGAIQLREEQPNLNFHLSRAVPWHHLLGSEQHRVSLSFRIFKLNGHNVRHLSADPC